MKFSMCIFDIVTYDGSCWQRCCTRCRVCVVITISRSTCGMSASKYSNVGTKQINTLCVVMMSHFICFAASAACLMTDEQVGKWKCKEKKRLCEENKKFPDRKDNEIL